MTILLQARILFLLGVTFAFGNLVIAAEIRVSEANEAALQTALAESRKTPEADRIVLKNGFYRISETIVLTRKDAGLTIETENPNGYCLISGATLLDPDVWTRVEGREEPIWETTVPEDYPEIRTLIRCSRSIPRARSAGYVQWDRPPERVPFRNRRAIDQRHLYLPKPVIEAFPDFTGAILRIIPRYPWSMHLLPMSEIDRDSGLVRSAVPGTYEMRVPAFGHFPEGSFWIENVPEAIDQRGEWCFNPETRKLTLWAFSSGDRAPQGVALPRLTELLRIEGEIDETDLEDKPVKGITIRGITFAHGNAYAWEEDKTGWGLQHDWEMYDRPTAMVRLRAAEDCLIENCRLINSGAAGIRLDLHCQRNTVRQSEFANLGGVGVLLAGYGLGYKDVNRDNVIADNHIHHIGEEWWHSPGIFAWQSGHNQIIHNHLHHLPYTGIVISTRTQLSVSGDKESSKTARWDDVVFHFETRSREWHDREPLMHGRFNEVAYNDIHHVMEKLGDGNGIYISGTGKSNRVHHNFIHDVASPNMNAAIRCDDDQHEVTVDHNVIARTCGEGLIWKGRCDVINNVVFALQSRTPEGVASRHQRGHLVLSGAPIDGSNVQRNIFLSKEARLPVLFEHPEPWKRGARTMPPVTLSAANSDHNLYWNTVNPQWTEEFFAVQRPKGGEQNSVFADPKLKDPKSNDFTFPADSPAVALGIEPVDISSVGPREEKKNANRD